jgi:colicin import membrane protein
MMLKTRHVAAAIALHLAVFGLLFSGVQCGRVPEPVTVIQGQLIAANEIPKAQSAPKPQPTPEPPTPEAVEPPPAPEPPKPDPVEVQRKQQEKDAKAEEAKKEQKAAEQKAAQDALLKKKAEEIADQKRLAEEAKKKKEAEDRKREEDLSRQAIEEEEKRLVAEKAEKKKKAEQARREAEERRAREAELSAALGAESEQRSAQEANIWGTQLVAAIQRVWTRPPGVSDQKYSCVVNMQLSATGEVLSARIQKSSGNPQIDESVLRAVYKASPMPLPRDPTVFQPGINITFIPR